MDLARRWSYEVRQPNISTNIEIKSRKESFQNYVPIELYSTYVYQVRIQLSGVQIKPNEINFLSAYIQLLDGSTNQFTDSNREKPVMEGSLIDHSSSDLLNLKINFKTTSYKLNNKSMFRLRLAIFQRNFSDRNLNGSLLAKSSVSSAGSGSFKSFGNAEDFSQNPILMRETEDSLGYVVNHNGFDPNVCMLACIISPEFFVYSKKNHTKESQYAAKASNRKARELSLLSESISLTDNDDKEPKINI